VDYPIFFANPVSVALVLTPRDTQKGAPLQGVCSVGSLDLRVGPTTNNDIINLDDHGASCDYEERPLATFSTAPTSHL
jgi:hypothetical protein